MNSWRNVITLNTFWFLCVLLMWVKPQSFTSLSEKGSFPPKRFQEFELVHPKDQHTHQSSISFVRRAPLLLLPIEIEEQMNKRPGGATSSSLLINFFRYFTFQIVRSILYFLFLNRWSHASICSRRKSCNRSHVRSTIFLIRYTNRIKELSLIKAHRDINTNVSWTKTVIKHHLSRFNFNVYQGRKKPFFLCYCTVQIYYQKKKKKSHFDKVACLWPGDLLSREDFPAGRRNWWIVQFQLYAATVSTFPPWQPSPSSLHHPFGACPCCTFSVPLKPTTRTRILHIKEQLCSFLGV